MRGLDLTIDYLEEHGFDRPILIETKDDLGLRVPPPSFKISDIERCVGMLCIFVFSSHDQDYVIASKYLPFWYTSL